MSGLANDKSGVRPTSTERKRSAFERHFEEPVNYDYGRYVVAANTDYEALDKLVAYFDGWNWVQKKYVIYQLRSTLTTAWVKWHGGLDEDGEMHNGWFLYEDDHWREPRFKRVWVATWSKHYFEFGHHLEPTIDDYGHQRSRNDCNICEQIYYATEAGKHAALTGEHNTKAEASPNLTKRKGI